MSIYIYNFDNIVKITNTKAFEEKKYFWGRRFEGSCWKQYVELKRTTYLDICNIKLLTEKVEKY